MGRLGDRFPDHERNRFVRRHQVPGKILYLFCHFTNPPKDKYLVLASVDPRPLVLVTNSAIHPFIRRNPHLLQCQVRLKAAEYAFLSHDSFVDCSRVYWFDSKEISAQLLVDANRVKGELSAASRAKITHAVQSASTLSPLHKRLIAKALGQDG